ncbi:unnamed protein product [Choristocarpus tenellus]
MGQKAGKAIYRAESRPFVNLTLAGVTTLWETFNDVADGFGINVHEFKEICAELAEELQLNRVKIDKRSEKLFRVMDSDNNGLVDAIEFISSMACASGVSITHTLEFIFNCYDFDSSSRLTIDEITLAMKSTITGLCKLSGDVCPRDVDFEGIAMDAFERRAGPDRFKVKVVDIVDYCQEHPEIRSWLDYFDDPPEQDIHIEEALPEDVDVRW